MQNSQHMFTPRLFKFLTYTGLLAAIVLLMASGCSSGNHNEAQKPDVDPPAKANPVAEVPVADDTDSVEPVLASAKASIKPVQARPVVLIYNFHLTNRCSSCIAIEEETGKTLENYFAVEMKQGRIVRKILNVDDKANKKIAEKYEAFGSGVFVTRVFQGKESTTDLTGTGFKFARNKPERYREILKNQIEEYLK